MSPLPEWARYKVLGYKMSGQVLIDIAMCHYQEMGNDPAALAKIRAGFMKCDWTELMNKTSWGVHEYLESKTDLEFRLYTQSIGKNMNPGFILAFCSSHPLFEELDDSFWAGSFQPEEKLARFDKFSTLIGAPGATPKWWIPDQALKITEMLTGESIPPVRRPGPTEHPNQVKLKFRLTLVCVTRRRVKMHPNRRQRQSPPLQAHQPSHGRLHLLRHLTLTNPHQAESWPPFLFTRTRHNIPTYYHELASSLVHPFAPERRLGSFRGGTMFS
jgi:hypothetical protein